ncbi:reverse transcriptase [Gossypium australe]|uniref:Reverse transcriptase n=1 Tax=Gossypium australe TaxID=47621 RepID=A0A5B6X2H2_9ROSI|nr:reverse transcriptase [Gossypium australe]
MDFVSGLPLTPTKKDSVWVIINCLTKSAHFLLVRTDYSLQKLAKLYVSEIISLLLLGFKRSFTMHWAPDWISVLCIILRQLDMLWSCGSWEDYLPLAEFAYNNNF